MGCIRALKEDPGIVLEQWGVPLVVLAMLSGLLSAAALLNRYQAGQARLRSAVCRLESAAAALAEPLDALRTVPLSRELRMLLRAEILAVYQRIRGVYRAYPGISQKIQAAEAALNAEGAPVAGGVGPIDDAQALHRVLTALDGLSDWLHQGRALQPLPRDVRAIFGRELGERRAEVLCRFHLVAARRDEEAGRIGRARGHFTALVQVLRRRGPRTEFVSELLAQTESAFLAFSSRRQKGPAATGRDDAGVALS